MTVEAWLRKNLHRYNVKTKQQMFKDCVKALKCHPHQPAVIFTQLKLRFPGGLLQSSMEVSKFKEQFDVPKQIMTALQELKANKRIIYDSDLKYELHIPHHAFCRATSLPQFDKYKLQIGKKTVWGAPRDLAMIKKEIDIA